ncbi:hypothetical protein AVEN_95933-1 [Araneus ventricosus]|uniref:Uncharacterized protein n=1 Tax=Araneus ventricosus TaxID=182803 RepID=A0A4Y2J7R7_ARAVE|nr:hypothetical protein AVEN_95933-1 [Araneus ventricosus]
MKRREIIPPEQYSATLKELRKKRLAEDESDASDLDEEVTEYSEHEADSKIDMENNTVIEEDNESNSNRTSSIDLISYLSIP